MVTHVVMEHRHLENSYTDLKCTRNPQESHSSDLVLVLQAPKQRKRPIE